jgi:hypothetical protein
MNKELIIKILIIIFIVFCGLVDLISAFNYRWSNNFNVNRYLGQFAGMERLIRYESLWQQAIQILSAFMVMPCFILVFAYTSNPELESLAVPFGLIASSILLGCKSLQMCELAKYNARHVWLGYISIFAISFIAIYIINYLGKDSISGILSVGIAIWLLLFPWTIIKLTYNRDYEYN